MIEDVNLDWILQIFGETRSIQERGAEKLHAQTISLLGLIQLRYAYLSIITASQAWQKLLQG